MFICLLQASVLENLRLAVRSQLGFTSIRLPIAGRSSNIWNRIFNFARSRHSGSLALVSSDGDDCTSQNPNREAERNGSHRSLFSVESDDTDTETERRDTAGAVGGVAATLPQKVPPTTAVEASVVCGTSSVQNTNSTDNGRETASVAPTSSSPGCHQFSNALSRMTQGLRWVRFTLGRSSSVNQNQSPLRQLDNGVEGGRADDDDVEMLIPVSDAASDFDVNDSSRPLLDLTSDQGFIPPHSVTHHGVQSCNRDGPCERCGIVHTAQIPDSCLEATLKNETSDDEALLLC